MALQTAPFYVIKHKKRWQTSISWKFCRFFRYKYCRIKKNIV